MGVKSVESSKTFFILLFLSCLNINEWGSLIFIFLCVYTIIKLGLEVPVDPNNYLLCTLLSVICALVSLFYFGTNATVKCINYCGAYIIGYSIISKAYNKVKLIKNCLFSIFAGYSCQIIFVFIYNIYKGQPSTRTLYAVWNDGLISVTLIALLSSVVIGYSFYAFFCSKNIVLIIYSFITLIITAMINILTATRTPFLLFAIVYLFLILAFFKNVHLSVKIKFAFVLLGIAIIAIICYQHDWFGIKTFWLNSALFERFGEEGVQTGRIEIAKQFISYMLQYPFGGGFARQEIHNYAHNILLEIYDMYGVIPFFITLVIYIEAIRNIILVVKKGKDVSCNHLLAGLYIAIIIQMFLEPVIEGFPILFYTFLFIHGICNSYIRFSREDKLVNEDIRD